MKKTFNILLLIFVISFTACSNINGAVDLISEPEQAPLQDEIIPEVTDETDDIASKEPVYLDPQPVQEPPPIKIKMELANDIQTAILDLFIPRDSFFVDELKVLNHNSFELYDFENNGIPVVIIEFIGYEWGWNEAYKYINGKYVNIGDLLYFHSFYTDDKGRLVLYEGGDDFVDQKLMYSYINISADELLRDTVYYDGLSVYGIDYYNKLNDIKFHWGDGNYAPDPRLLDKSIKRIASIDSSDIETKISQAYTTFLSKVKTEGKVLIEINRDIKKMYDNPVVEYEGAFYIPAQLIVDNIQGRLEYDEYTKAITIYSYGDYFVETGYVDEIFQCQHSNHDISVEPRPPRIINDVLMLPSTFCFSFFSIEYFQEQSIIFIEHDFVDG